MGTTLINGLLLPRGKTLPCSSVEECPEGRLHELTVRDSNAAPVVNCFTAAKACAGGKGGAINPRPSEYVVPHPPHIAWADQDDLAAFPDS